MGKVKLRIRMRAFGKIVPSFRGTQCIARSRT